MFNFAREYGYTDTPNPCASVRGHRETDRDRYVEDEEFLAVWNHAHYTVQGVMGLAHLTGQRPVDLLKMDRGDIRDGELCLAQDKTGKKLCIKIMGGDALLQDENGQRLTYGALRTRFDKARKAANVDFQFCDIRAKIATDTGDLARAQKLLRHKTRSMAEGYTRDRKDNKVNPLK